MISTSTVNESKYTSMGTEALRCLYMKEFKKATRVLSASTVPYNGFYGCYGSAPAIARSLRNVTKSLDLIKEELRRRENSLQGHPNDSTFTTSDTGTVSTAATTAQVGISVNNLPPGAEVEMIIITAADVSRSFISNHHHHHHHR